MKRLSVILICLLIFAALASCGYEQLPESDDVAPIETQKEPEKSIEEQGPLLSAEFDTNTLKTSAVDFRGITFSLADGKLDVSGYVSDETQKYIMVNLNMSEEAKIYAPVIDGEFHIVTDILPLADEMPVDIYAGKEEFGMYRSVILDFVRIINDGGVWRIKESPVYKQNIELFCREKDMEESLFATDWIQSDDSRIAELSDSITAGCRTDYDKAKAVHDWLAENIYYDFDALAAGRYDESDALSVLENKRGVCEGFANLGAALLRHQGIPCVVQGGYALGISTDRVWNEANVNTTESNHAWNEVYVDGRWILMDATWDTDNEYRNGAYEQGEFIGDTYFDTDHAFFALSHKAMDN